MKLIGSISKYFPFLSVNTLSKVESILSSASDYESFIERLCHEAIKKDAFEDLVVFACILANSGSSPASMQEIVAVHPDILPGKIYKLQQDLVFGKRDDWESLFSLTYDVIDSGLEPWVEFQIHGVLWNAYLSRSVGSLEEEDSERRMWELIGEEPDLEPFKASLYQLRAYRLRAEGSEKKAVEEFKKALAIAEKFDDQILAARLHTSIAWGLRNFETKAAIYHFEKAAELDPRETGHMVFLHNIRGEYDYSIEHNLKAIEYMDSKHSNPHYGSVAIILSALYLQIGRPEDALEWAEMSLEKGFFPGPDPAVHSNHLTLANALAVLGKIEMAQEHLDFAKGQMLRTGAEIQIAEVHFTTGMIETAKGHYKEALWSFSQAVEIYEKHPRQTRVNRCLRRLAETEVALYSVENGEMETPWLTKYEETSRERDYPGHIGLALLNKAHLKLKQNRLTEAREILDELVEISKRKGTRFLQPLLVSLLEPMEAK